MPIIQGELGDLTPEEAEAREQGVKSVKEELARESNEVQTVVIPIAPGEQPSSSPEGSGRSG